MAGRPKPSTSPLIAQVLAALQRAYPQLNGVTVDDSGGDTNLNLQGAAGLSYRPGETPFIGQGGHGFISMQTGASLGANQGLSDPSQLQLAVLKHELGHQMEPFLLGGGDPSDLKGFDAHKARVNADRFLDISGIGRANNILQQTIQGRGELRREGIPRDKWGLPTVATIYGSQSASPMEEYANMAGLQFGGQPNTPTTQWGLTRFPVITDRNLNALVGAGLLPRPYSQNPMPKW